MAATRRSVLGLLAASLAIPALAQSRGNGRTAALRIGVIGAGSLGASFSTSRSRHPTRKQMTGLYRIA